MTSVAPTVDERVVSAAAAIAAAVSSASSSSTPSGSSYLASLSSPVSGHSNTGERSQHRGAKPERLPYSPTDRPPSREELLNSSTIASAQLDSSGSSSSSPLQPNLQSHHLSVTLPRSPGGATMAHSIQHKFKDELFPAPGSKCDFCAKALISGKTFSMKCKVCLHCR